MADLEIGEPDVTAAPQKIGFWGQQPLWKWAPVTPEMWDSIKPRRLNDHTERWFVIPIRTQAGGQNLLHVPQEYADKLEAARQSMHSLFLAATEESSMQSVIAQAADAQDVKREDLCLYLMCLGLMTG